MKDTLTEFACITPDSSQSNKSLFKKQHIAYTSLVIIFIRKKFPPREDWKDIIIFKNGRKKTHKPIRNPPTCVGQRVQRQGEFPFSSYLISCIRLTWH